MSVEKLNIKNVIYEKEERFLSPFATKSNQTKGRLKQEDECPTRTDFQRDRDRIVYSMTISVAYSHHCILSVVGE